MGLQKAALEVAAPGRRQGGNLLPASLPGGWLSCASGDGGRQEFPLPFPAATVYSVERVLSGSIPPRRLPDTPQRVPTKHWCEERELPWARISPQNEPRGVQWVPADKSMLER